MKSVKKLIMLILFLLVALFMAGMGIMSSLNLRYSQEAMSRLRVRQIEEALHANQERIDARHMLMEKNAEALARLGELFLRIDGHTGQRARTKLEDGLVAKVRDFPQASGGGLWFEPGAWPGAGRNAAVYVGWKGQTVAVIDAYASAVYDHTGQSWYRTALAATAGGSEGVRLPGQGARFYWTPAYFDTVQEDAFVTVATPMRDDRGRTIGLATTSWRADDIIRLISGVDVTPGSFAFLIDRNGRKLTSLSDGSGAAQADALIAALAAQKPAAGSDPADLLSGSGLRPATQTTEVDTDGRAYAVYLSRTRAGMVFGIGVPRDEIDSVLVPMRATNYRIAIVTGVVLLILSGIILYVVAGILRLLETLYTDPLTRLPNRARLLRDSEAPKDETLILLNIDAFKEINDFYGAQCGDHVLHCVAEELQAFARGSEHWRSALIYKLPGDEFAVLVRNRLGVDALAACLRDLSAYMRSRVFRWEGQEIGVSVTLGAAGAADCLPSHEMSGETLLSSANIALKLARLQHRHYTVYDPGLKVREEYEQNLIWAKRLKAALDEDRLVPYFQPIVDNRSGTVEKFECLVRMLDKQGRPVGPGQFLGVAKKLRLYREVTRIMVEKSFAAFQDTPYDFSLNLSYEDLADPEITGFIKRRLRETGIGERVIFEILESEGIENYQDVRAFIDEVKILGCRIAIDDFGTGYSNFDHLLRLNADFIKIDGSLIRSLDTDTGAWIVTRGIVQFARELGMRTVAEFVHSEAVQEKVLTLGIDYSQGAQFGMPAEAPVTAAGPASLPASPSAPPALAS